MKALFFLVAFIPLNLWAHPVSFRDSIGVMGFHAPNLSHNQINYSLRHWVALGVHHFSVPQSTNNNSATLASANLLLKRWNGKALQANVYAVLGGGHSSFSNQDKSVGLSGLQFDIEDRDYYFLAKQVYFGDFRQREFSQTFLRLGVSPYVEGYDGFHSWLIFEWQSQRQFQQPTFEDLTPFLRFFYKNLLFEIGQSFKGISRFNYIIHF